MSPVHDTTTCVPHPPSVRSRNWWPLSRSFGWDCNTCLASVPKLWRCIWMIRWKKGWWVSWLFGWNQGYAPVAVVVLPCASLWGGSWVWVHSTWLRSCLDGSHDPMLCTPSYTLQYHQHEWVASMVSVVVLLPGVPSGNWETMVWESYWWRCMWKRVTGVYCLLLSSPVLHAGLVYMGCPI